MQLALFVYINAGLKCSAVVSSFTRYFQEMIVKKMSELKLPVDEDFAEYIMVMLHNNKTQKEVQTDLEPFLGTQTAVFTPWLFSIIEPESTKPGISPFLMFFSV